MLSRRRLLKGATVAAFATALPARHAFSQVAVDLVPDVQIDQTAALQAAIDAAATSGGHLFIPAGRYRTGPVRLPSGFMLSGVPGASILAHTASGPLLSLDGQSDVLISGISIDGNGAAGEIWHGGAVHIANCENVTLRDCAVSNTGLNGISMLSSSGTIENSKVRASAYTGIFIYDASATHLTGNRILDCANGGIRVWRGEQGPDGTIVSGNTIAGIDWRDAGNGQNGNGINIFRADNVIVANNSISDCSFSAVRLNSTNNTHIVSNTCLNSLEVAVYSEFSFTGSVIADNIIDGAAGGISITNFNDGGRLATCTGNIVRNLTAGSTTNPDLSRPYGIAAEADAVISNNVVENVAGSGIVAGWGHYLRDVAITDNVVREVDIGIGVSVAPEAGPAIVTGNVISGARDHAIAGTAWSDVVSADLASDASAFPHTTVSGNTVL